MSGLSSPHSYPHPESDELRQFIGKDKESFLNPIDESEDFYDPFSDLSLFLSRKIKGEIQESGSVSKWSGKIEANLLAKILPEFKQKFPKYRLGTSALKKVWEKVSYYYEKIQGQKGALHTDGKLNLKFMIRENLKSCGSPIHLPPYSFAQQLAGKLSECIATIEGKRPELEQLTKVIWAVQKHLVKDLSPVNAKSPYEEYDIIDKLIVKTLLEITSKGGTLEPDTLKKEIAKELQLYEGTKTLTQKCQLSSTVSMILAEKLYHTSLISCHFSLKEKQQIETFIRYQTEISKNNPTLTSDEHRIELIQRILALYAIAQELPKNLSEEALRKSIREIRMLAQEKNGLLSNRLDQTLFVFSNAEMHLMSESKSFDDLAALEDSLVEAYHIALQLPALSPSQMDQFELLIWKIIEEEGALLDHISPQTRQIIEKEVGNILIDNPCQSFRMIVSAALQFFKKVQKVDLDPQNLNEKIEVWVLQNDMLIRWVHFDHKTPLLALLKNLWNTSHLDEHTVNHEEFITHALTYALETHPLLHPFEELLRGRLWILYKYLWYTTFTDGRESTYERFLMWHRTRLQHLNPDFSAEKVEETLQKLSNQLIPLAPFENVS